MEINQNEVQEFLTLKEAADILSVNIETLLEWNNSNILKPIITKNQEVGYTKNQIDKFLSLRQLFQDNTNNQHDISSNNPSCQNNNARNDLSAINKDSSIVSETDNNNVVPQDVLSSKFNKKFVTVGILSSFLLAIILLSLSAANPAKNTGYFTNENLLISEANTSTLPIPQKSNIGVVDLRTYNSQQPPSEEISTDSKVASPESKPSAFAMMINDLRNTQIKNTQPDGTPFPLEKSQVENNIDGIKINPVNYAARSNTSKVQYGLNEILENDQSLYNESTPLSAAIGTDIFRQENNTGNTKSINIILATLTLGLLWIVYLFNVRPAYTLLPDNNVSSVPQEPSQTGHDKSSAVVNQKTDGTVVIIFDGQEYKISKPELNSETDRFIERLLWFANNNLDQFEYDILKDNQLKLNTPLSKLVTRLGFVGKKRDLFFPRTSKNKVVFRRVVTKNDLLTMGLNSEQIVDQIIGQ